MFLGIAIGDALGMCCENLSYDCIKRKYGKIDSYLSAREMQGGSYTDDTQLTLSVANALIEARTINLDIIVKHQIEAYKQTTAGWGSTTREACKRLSEGIHWSISAGSPTEIKPKGFGNGVVMKASPISAYLYLNGSFKKNILIEQLVAFTSITHKTSIAISSCLAHVFGVLWCLECESDTFHPQDFLDIIIRSSKIGESYLSETIVDRYTDRLELIKKLYEENDTWHYDELLVKNFNGGTPYVYDSIPQAYAFFVRNPTIESLYDAVKGGGDTDTNASVVGGLLGALHGTDIFPKNLVNGLKEKEVILETADKFFTTFTTASKSSKMK